MFEMFDSGARHRSELSDFEKVRVRENSAAGRGPEDEHGIDLTAGIARLRPAPLIRDPEHPDGQVNALSQGNSSTNEPTSRQMQHRSKGLHVKRLRKSFGRVQALDSVTLSVAPGEVVGFVGANGAGKSTTMRIILGLSKPDAGAVTWNGAETTAQFRSRIGYMPEERGLYPRMRVRDQLIFLGRLHGLSKQESSRSCDHLLSRLQLQSRSGDLLHTLSLGNQQRVQLAATLIHSPEIIILDEPFSGLDIHAVGAMQKVLREEANRGAGILLSSHQLEIVEQLCDRVVILDEGRVVANESTAELLRPTRAIEVCTSLRADEIASVVGVHPDELRPGLFRLHVPEDRSQSDILSELVRLGEVTSFHEVEVSLAEAFRGLIQPIQGDL